MSIRNTRRKTMKETYFYLFDLFCRFLVESKFEVEIGFELTHVSG